MRERLCNVPHIKCKYLLLFTYDFQLLGRCCKVDVNVSYKYLLLFTLIFNHEKNDFLLYFQTQFSNTTSCRIKHDKDNMDKIL